MTGPGPLFLGFLFAFILLLVTVALENRRAKRLFLVSFRESLDRLVTVVTDYLSRKYRYFTNHVIQLSWYYSLHKLLRGLMVAIVKIYDYMELVFIKNRARAKILRREKKLAEKGNGYFSQVAEHKEVIKLSESQKEKLLQKTLEGK